MLSNRGLGRGCRLLLFFALLLLLFGTIANGQVGKPKPLGQEEEQRKNNVDIAQTRGRRQQQRPEGGGQQDGPPAKPTGTVGFGNHTLMEDGKVHLAPGWDTKGFSDCVIKIKQSEGKKEIIVSRKHPDKGCTVDLVTSDEKDEFEFLAVLEPEEEDKTLEDCITDSDTDNTMQFNYGKTNEELELYVERRIDNPHAEGCNNEECTKLEASCLDSSSLEISWRIKEGNYDFVLLPLGEPNVESIIAWEPTEIAGKNVARVHSKILKNTKGNGGAYEINKEEATPTEIVKSEEAEPICIAKDKAVPPPVFWPILDKEGKPIEGKKLLVFQLLPMGASYLTNEPTPPKCRLSFIFAADKYPLLSNDALVAPKTTEGTTTPNSTTLESTTTKEPTTMNSAASKQTTQPGAPSSTTDTKSSAGKGPFFYAAIIGGAALILALTGFLIWFCVCRRKGKEDTDSSGEDEEEVEDSEAASAPSDVCIGTSAEQKSTSFYVDTALTTPVNNRKRSS